MVVSGSAPARQVINKLSFGREDHQQGIKEDELETAKAQMGQVREENDRLKTMLGKIEKDYQSLRLRFFNRYQQQSSNKASEDDLVSLCLGMNSPKTIKKDDKPSCKSIQDDQDLVRTGLSLRLMSTELLNDPTQENRFEDKQKEEEEEACPPSKMQKTMPSGDDEVSQAQAKRSRVSVRARCDTPTMNDGCQWRKYGQKIAKANPCPRAYYRCTAAPGCPVRKQVQRCIDDMSILITTYEGAHNHSLPMSATAMASTTSAAASMLLSGSLSSATTKTLNVPNYNFYDNPGTSSTRQQFYMHNSSSSPFPTITLDLTSSSSSPYSSHLNMFPSSTQSYSSINLGFSTLEPNMVWSNEPKFGSLCFGKMSQEKLYQPNIEKTQQAPPQFLTETLTRAITSDPSLRSAIATAISSMVGEGRSNGNQKEVDGQNMKWNEPVPSDL